MSVHQNMLDEFGALAVDRIIVHPRKKSAEASDGLAAFTEGRRATG